MVILKGRQLTKYYLENEILFEQYANLIYLYAKKIILQHVLPEIVLRLIFLLYLHDEELKMVHVPKEDKLQ